MASFPAGLVVGRPSSELGEKYIGNYRGNVNILICKVGHKAQHNGIRDGGGGVGRHIRDWYLYQMEE